MFWFSQSPWQGGIAPLALEVSLPWNFAFEDALYSRLGNTFYIPLIANEADIRTIANSWQFSYPRYRVPVSRVSPFASIGLAARYASGRMNTIHYGHYPGDVRSHRWTGTLMTAPWCSVLETGREPATFLSRPKSDT